MLKTKKHLTIIFTFTTLQNGIFQPVPGPIPRPQGSTRRDLKETIEVNPSLRGRSGQANQVSQRPPSEGIQKGIQHQGLQLANPGN